MNNSAIECRVLMEPIAAIRKRLATARCRSAVPFAYVRDRRDTGTQHGCLCESDTHEQAPENWEGSSDGGGRGDLGPAAPPCGPSARRGTRPWPAAASRATARYLSGGRGGVKTVGVAWPARLAVLPERGTCTAGLLLGLGTATAGTRTRTGTGTRTRSNRHRHRHPLVRWGGRGLRCASSARVCVPMGRGRRVACPVHVRGVHADAALSQQ